MEENIIEEIVKDRVEENKGLFSLEEHSIIENNINLAKKMYIL